MEGRGLGEVVLLLLLLPLLPAAAPWLTFCSRAGSPAGGSGRGVGSGLPRGSSGGAPGLGFLSEFGFVGLFCLWSVCAPSPLPLSPSFCLGVIKAQGFGLRHIGMLLPFLALSS